MTPIDALAHQQRDARAALLARIDELGDLLLIARRQAELGNPHRIGIPAMKLRLVAIDEAAEILAATTEALDAAAALAAIR